MKRNASASTFRTVRTRLLTLIRQGKWQEAANIACSYPQLIQSMGLLENVCLARSMIENLGSRRGRLFIRAVESELNSARLCLKAARLVYPDADRELRARRRRRNKNDLRNEAQTRAQSLKADD